MVVGEFFRYNAQLALFKTLFLFADQFLFGENLMNKMYREKKQYEETMSEPNDNWCITEQDIPKDSRKIYGLFRKIVRPKRTKFDL